MSVLPARVSFRNHAAGLCAMALGLIAAGCGGSGQNPIPLTNLPKRALVTNQENGGIIIVDAQKDAFSFRALGAFDAANMATAGGQTIVMQQGQANATIVNNAEEATKFNPSLDSPALDVAVNPDGKTAYAALRNAGEVAFITTADGTVKTAAVPSAHRLVLSPNGTKLLVFPDDPQSLTAPNTNSFFVVDTGTMAVTPISGPGIDQPFTAVFNGSETNAFILNCGAECGGTAASVTQVDFSGMTPVISPAIPVSGATVGFLSGTNLFVAGTPAGSSSGTLQVINTSAGTASAPIAIPDGTHVKMRLASNNRLYVGSTNCTPVPDSATGQIHGCLAIVNTTNNAVVVPEFSSLRGSNFNVTGMQPISGRNVIYVCEGGELDIFDTTTDALTPNQLDVVGKAIDVVQIDP